MAPVLKTGDWVTGPGVRIPLLPFCSPLLGPTASKSISLSVPWVPKGESPPKPSDGLQPCTPIRGEGGLMIVSALFSPDPDLPVAAKRPGAEKGNLGEGAEERRE